MPEDPEIRLVRAELQRLDTDIGRAARKADEVEARAKERVDEMSRAFTGELARVLSRVDRQDQRIEANTEFRNRMIGIGIAIGFVSGTVAGLIAALITSVLG